MKTTEDILQFHFSSVTFQLSAENIIPPKLIKQNNEGIKKLMKILDQVGEKKFSFSGKDLIPQVFKKFKKSIKTNLTSFDRKELRTLTYSLNHSEQSLQPIFCNAIELKYALTLLEAGWRDSYLIGLIDCLLRNWETKYEESFEYLQQFLTSKLENYSGNRSIIISFYANKMFFNRKNGGLILGDTIARLNKPIQDATRILGVPESWISYPYFSKVIISYYERSKSKIIEEIENLNEVLQKHNSSITNKRLLSKIIIQANRPDFSLLQEKIKKIAFTKIGDPSNISTWTVFENATETEKKEIIEARAILNEWITKQFINVFFDVCINDHRRKRFWLHYASKISSFKVYGPSYTKNILKRDKRIAEFVDARFESVSSKSDVSAFILYIGDYMLIEFSIVGYAFYAYKNSSRFRPSLNHQLSSVDDLRRSSMPMAIQNEGGYLYMHDEGRLTHRDGNQLWETKFNSWINKNVFG